MARMLLGLTLALCISLGALAEKVSTSHVKKKHTVIPMLITLYELLVLSRVLHSILDILNSDINYN